MKCNTVLTIKSSFLISKTRFEIANQIDTKNTHVIAFVGNVIDSLPKISAMKYTANIIKVNVVQAVFKAL